MRDDIVVWIDDATGARLIERLDGRFLVLFEIERKQTSDIIDDRSRVFGEDGSQIEF